MTSSCWLEAVDGIDPMSISVILDAVHKRERPVQSTDEVIEGAPALQATLDCCELGVSHTRGGQHCTGDCDY